MTEEIIEEAVFKDSITQRERKLIGVLRGVQYGQVIIYLEAGQPVRIEQIKKSVKL